MLNILADYTSIPISVQLGLAGALMVGFLSGQIVPGFIAKRSEERANQAEERERGLYDKMMDQAIPALEQSAKGQLGLLEIMPQLLDVVRNYQRDSEASRITLIKMQSENNAQASTIQLLASMHTGQAVLQDSGKTPPPAPSITPPLHEGE